MISPQEFLAQFTDVLNIEVSDAALLTMDTRVSDLAYWDSIALISLIIFANIKFSKEISADRLKTCVTIRDIYQLIDQ